MNERNKKELTVEIRFPFCEGRCDFCGKNALSRDKKLISAYWTALRKEIASAAEELAEYRVSAVHIGYGTPLAGGLDDLADFLLFLRNILPTDGETRWSMRVLPYQLSAAALTVLRNGGIDSLVLEVMTCRSDEFAKLRRPYYFAAFDGAVSLLTMSRQEELYLELLLGIEGQTPQTLRETLDYALKAQPTGISLKYYDPAQAETPALTALRDTAEERLREAGMSRYGGGLHYASAGKEPPYLTARGDRMGFGAGAVTELEGLRYHNTTNLFLYMAHPDEPQLIACPEQ